MATRSQPLMITAQNFQNLQARIQRMSRKPKQIKVRDALKMLMPTIQDALRQGYSLSDVCRLLEEYGVAMTENKLKRLLQSAKVPFQENGLPQEEREVNPVAAPVAAKVSVKTPAPATAKTTTRTRISKGKSALALPRS